MSEKAFLEFVESPDPLERHLKAAAFISEQLATSGLKPIVVGGSAVEFYTRGAHLTMDLDLVVSGLAEVAALLEKLGFRRSGPSFHHPKVELVVDLPAELLVGDPGAESLTFKSPGKRLT